MFTRSVSPACIESNLLLLLSDIFLTRSTEIIKYQQQTVQSVRNVEISLLMFGGLINSVWQFPGEVVRFSPIYTQHT